MTTRDLRIGDKVVYDGVVHEIIQLNNLSVRILRNGYGRLVLSEDLEPIPITEELLLKLGFKKDTYPLAQRDYEPIEFIYSYSLDICDYTISIITCSKDEKCFMQIDNTGEAKCYIAIKYLHQLQNAIYLTTGNELNVNTITDTPEPDEISDK